MDSPAWVIPVFVEDDDGAWFDPMADDFEDGAGGGVEIAVDVEEGDVSGMGSGEIREALVEPAADEAGVFGDIRWILGEHSRGEAGAPLFWQTFKTIEAEDGFLPMIGDDTQGAAGSDAEFEDEAFTGRTVESGAEKVVGVAEAGGVGCMVGDVGGRVQAGGEGHHMVDVEGVV